MFKVILLVIALGLVGCELPETPEPSPEPTPQPTPEPMIYLCWHWNGSEWVGLEDVDCCMAWGGDCNDVEKWKECMEADHGFWIFCNRRKPANTP